MAWLVFLAFHMNSERSAGTNKLLLTDTEHAALVAQTSQAIPSQADCIRVRGWLVQSRAHDTFAIQQHACSRQFAPAGRSITHGTKAIGRAYPMQTAVGEQRSAPMAPTAVGKAGG